ncbi:MAG: GAF domain-containing protein [candidate division Zixibacteria bacterium]|nr:GAF domain-containing protein [candidate division Zixibacteria bacterium]
MSLFILDLFFALTFVVLLGLLVRVRERVFRDNRESYRCTVGGLFSLGIVSVIQLVSHQELLHQVPLLSEPIYLEVIEIIGIITGITLLISGISVWIPGRRGNTETEKTSRSRVAIDDILLRLMRVDATATLFDEIPRMIADRFGFDSLAVFRRHHSHKRIMLTDESNLASSIRGDIKRSLRLTGSVPKLVEAVRKATGPVGEIPLTIGARTVGAILFWKDHPEKLCEEELNALRRLSTALSSVLDTRYLDIKSEYYEGSWRHFAQVRDILTSRKDLKSNLQSFYYLFRQAVGAEYLSLGLIESGRENVKRFTIGVNASVLLDGVTNPTGASSCFTQVVDQARGLRVADVRNERIENVDSLSLSCGQRSLMAVPVLQGGSVIAVLTLGHRAPNRFSRRDLLRAEMLAQAMTPVVASELHRRAILMRDRQLSALMSFNAAMESAHDVDTLFDAAAETLLKGIGTSLVRVTTLDRQHQVLETQAIKTVRPFDEVRTDAVAVSRQMTRWHEMVLDQQRPLLLNQRDPETAMDKPEMDSLVMPGMQSALILPIAVNGLVIGLVTLGEMRRWERFSYDSLAITFGREVIARLVSGIKLLQMSRIISSSKAESQPAPVIGTENDRFRELKSPVTSLRGSLDLLKIRGMHDEVYADELMHAMERSTDRIMSLLNES